MSHLKGRVLAIVALVMTAGVLISVSHATPVSAGGNPPPCIPVGNHCYTPCSDPSGLCPPNTQFYPWYTWQGGGTGSQWSDEFTGSSVDNDVWYVQGEGGTGYAPCTISGSLANCPAQADTWWAPGNTSVSGGTLNLKTNYETTGAVASACETAWAAQGHGTPSGCWVSGAVEQCEANAQCTAGSGSGYEPFMSSGQIAVDARFVNGPSQSDEIGHVDSTFQAGSYQWSNMYGSCEPTTSPKCTWPPEIDSLETGWAPGSLAKFDENLHCLAKPGGSNTAETNGPTTADLSGWNVIEVEWTTSDISVWDTDVSTSTTTRVAHWTSPTAGGCGGSGAYWPPSAATALGAYLQAEMNAQNINTTQEGYTQTMQIDWVAEINHS